MIRLCFTTCLLLLSFPAFSQTTQIPTATAPKLPQTVTDVFANQVTSTEKACVALAKAMPADRYQFVPTNGEFKGVRSFALLARHIAVVNYESGAALLREEIPIDVGIHENGPESIKTKEQIVKFLEGSFTYLLRGVSTVNEKNLMELVNYAADGRFPRLLIVQVGACHPMDLYGQMIEYLRMNNIDPQKI
jgi:hypothetical protein